MDISPETVGTLSNIMLAQAQEVFFLKAASGTKGHIKGSKPTQSFVFSQTLFLNLSENDMGLRKALKGIQQDIEIEYPAFIQGDLLRMRQLEGHFESAYIRQHQKPYMALIGK